MTLSTTIIYSATSFLLGLIFVSQTVDIPLLYRPQLTEQALEDAYTFYSIWWEAPGAVKAVLHTALGLPLVPLVYKLHKWSESAMFFDGSSLVLYMATIVLYLTIHIPCLQTFLPDSATTTSFSILPPPAPRLVEPTALQREEAVRVMAAGNALIGVCLVGILCMQGGQAYAKWQEEIEQRKVDESSAAAAAVVGEGKKDQ